MSTDTISTGPGRPRDEEATAAILAATLRLLAARGYAGTSTSDIAAAARASKATVYRRWPSKPALFAQAALRHSQCPTAMDGGLLGTVKRGQLYSELEPEAFALALGEVSAVLASPVGLHLIYCEEIPPAGMLAFTEVREHIVERLGDKRRRDAQRSWIKQLFARSDTRQPA